jgi:hypothetical protein
MRGRAGRENLRNGITRWFRREGCACAKCKRSSERLTRFSPVWGLTAVTFQLCCQCPWMGKVGDNQDYSCQITQVKDFLFRDMLPIYLYKSLLTYLKL